MAEFIAVLSCALFTGAAVYMTFVEHPARVQCGVEHDVFSREPAVPMIMSIDVTLGIFLPLAVRDSVANRSLIAFGGWANLAHAGVMAAQEYRT